MDYELVSTVANPGPQTTAARVDPECINVVNNEDGRKEGSNGGNREGDEDGRGLRDSNI